MWVKTHFFGRTPREIREATKPPFFDFPVYYSNSLLLVVVALVYAPIAPLVALFGVGAFAIQYWVSKYNLLYVAVPRSETGGRLWNVAINRCLMALVRVVDNWTEERMLTAFALRRSSCISSWAFRSAYRRRGGSTP